MRNAGFTETIGLEPSSAPIQAAHPDIRDHLRNEMFREGLFPHRSCSLITCFQTIEHVPDPLSLCREAARLLQPGGVVAIIAHNRRGLLNRLMGRKSPIFDIEHLQLFSPDSLKKLLEAAGFTQVTVSPFRNTYPLSYWARLFPFPAMVKPGVLRALQGTIGSLPLSFPVGNLLCTAQIP
jgi:SAM-dependent methyltransferase